MPRKGPLGKGGGAGEGDAPGVGPSPELDKTSYPTINQATDSLAVLERNRI